jgi:hypothetical protein
VGRQGGDGRQLLLQAWVACRQAQEIAQVHDLLPPSAAAPPVAPMCRQLLRLAVGGRSLARSPLPRCHRSAMSPKSAAGDQPSNLRETELIRLVPVEACQPATASMCSAGVADVIQQ